MLKPNANEVIELGKIKQNFFFPNTRRELPDTDIIRIHFSVIQIQRTIYPTKSANTKKQSKRETSRINKKEKQQKKKKTTIKQPKKGKEE